MMLTDDIRAAAARGLRLEIERLQQALGALEGPSRGRSVRQASPKPQAASKRRRRMSPEARKRMSEMMKKRWADRRRAAKK